MDERQRAKIEWLKCTKSCAYFIDQYCQIYNATDREWVAFRLWPAQTQTLARIADNRLLIILKARQLGLSWLVLCYVLWHMLFRPAATALLFSKRDDEATELLDARLKEIYARLPEWMRARTVELSDKHNWQLSNGSGAKAFPTTGGRSYTGSIVVVDEADFVQDLDSLLNAVKPTIDAGGQMIMVSTVDKSQPRSAFKRIYEGATRGETEWTSVFLPWHSRPSRDAGWYNAQIADIMARTGALDDLHQEYPATDAEALAPRTLDKRIASIWIQACYAELTPIDDSRAPALPGLVIYRRPQEGRIYVVGVDSAEGNPSSDDSALTVLDAWTGEEVASLAGKFQPSALATYADQVGRYYNNAALMVERNNHGHAVLLWLEDHSKLWRLLGHDGRAGWLSSGLGKALLYNTMADTFRDGDTIMHSLSTFVQMASIEGSTLRAPKNEHDDRADSYALANAGRAPAISGPPKMTSGKVDFYGKR